MSAPVSGKFQDHYVVLGVEPTADSDAIGTAYSSLSQRYHPKNKDTGDEEKYKAVTLAYEVLADPVARKAFDEIRSGPAKESAPAFAGQDFFIMMSQEVLRRKAILSVLYDRRRQYPLRPALSLKQIENVMVSSSDELQFSIWYLKQKGYASSDDKSNTQITVQGMDYLDERLPSPEAILSMIKASAGGSAKPASDPAAPVDAPASATGSLLSLAEGLKAPAPALEKTPAAAAQFPNSNKATASTPAFMPPAPVGAPLKPAAPARGALNLPKRTIVIPPRGKG